ncbi:MAG: DNA lyase [Nanoarchaeota archaeon]
MENIKQNYNLSKKIIQSRLKDFKNLSEEEQFREFMFCLLTPQSNAQKCWSAIEIISKLKDFKEEAIFDALKSRTRFHITKTKRLMGAKESWEKIKHSLDNNNIKELRNFIAETVNGYGLKEASHFLRNIGKSNNQIAILDRHILKNLKNNNIIQEAKIKNKKAYFEIENAFLNFADKVKIPVDELDMLWWSQENGEIFK